MDRHHFTSESLDVAVKAGGAELCSLEHRRYGELLWQAGPAWPQHAPNLFPIVGQLAGDQLRHDGAVYPLGRHGFARNREFTWLERSASGCRLELRDDDRTRAHYPFAFRFEIGYALVADTLHVRYTIANPGADTLPASVGAHPAFRWPLADGIAKNAHSLVFSDPEPAPIRRLRDGLLEARTYPTPIAGNRLDLREDLFAADAIVLDRLASNEVRYGAPGAPLLVIAWDGFRELGLWMKPGANFLCIEPWYGYASPADFDAEFATKPGLLLIAPGESRTLTFSIRAGDAA